VPFVIKKTWRAKVLGCHRVWAAVQLTSHRFGALTKK
jgi:hypothetical protein